MDLLEHAVPSEVGDAEVAHRGVEELAVVDDVARIEHLEPDIPDARVPGAVRGDRDRAVCEVDGDDALRADQGRHQAGEQPGASPEIEDQLARFRVREAQDLLGDRLKVGHHVPIVRLGHSAELVDVEQRGLVRVHRDRDESDVSS